MSCAIYWWSEWRTRNEIISWDGDQPHSLQSASLFQMKLIPTLQVDKDNKAERVQEESNTDRYQGDGGDSLGSQCGSLQSSRLWRSYLQVSSCDLTTSQTHKLTTLRPHKLTTSWPHDLMTSRPHNLTTSRSHDLTTSISGTVRPRSPAVWR